MRCIDLEKGNYPDHTTKWMNPDNTKPEPVTRGQILQRSHLLKVDRVINLKEGLGNGGMKSYCFITEQE